MEKQLTEEVEVLLRLAEKADNRPVPEKLEIPAELARREARLAAIGEAKKEIEARARQRHAKEQGKYEEKMEKRKRYEEETGKKPRGKTPKPPKPGPQDKDQVNLTDEESRIMPNSSGGFEQSYNAQASVEIESGLIITQHITQHTNDQQELVPTLAQLQEQEAALGLVEDLLSDGGYQSEANVEAGHAQQIKPSLSLNREKHNPPLEERFQGPLESSPPSADDPVGEMKYRLSTPQGKALYAKRKSTIEPTFGVIKHGLGFRQFLLRGLEAVGGEWDLVCIAYNLKKMHRLMA